MIYRSFIKPFFDVVASVSGLLLLAPLLLLTMLLLLISNKGKIFFLQPRPGRNGRIFHVIKLKTMTDEKDAEGNLLPDHQRLKGVGRWVRRLSLDEIPQLINVIKGDMSLVGPRPLLVAYLPLYSAKHARRHEVKPGITGLAQVNGRNLLSWEQKFEYDVWYVDHLSFRTDLMIIGKTIGKLFSGEGINADANNTMERFTGLKQES